MIKRYKFIILAILAIVSLVLGELAKEAKYPPAPLAPLSTPVTTTDWQRGTPEAQAVVVVYSDFACLTCDDIASSLKQLTINPESEVLMVYRHFVGASSTVGKLAASAVEAAGLQDQFWPMHDLLYDRQSVWIGKEDPSDLLLAYAASLHLNLDRFQRDMTSAAVLKKIEADYQSGLSSGLVEAPALFLNGARVQARDL